MQGAEEQHEKQGDARLVVDDRALRRRSCHCVVREVVGQAPRGGSQQQGVNVRLQSSVHEAGPKAPFEAWPYVLNLHQWQECPQIVGLLDTSSRW
jgi:hypothetical protein